MTDIVTPKVRSRMMARIKGSDTAPEIAVRRYLHAAGLRFRLHVKNLPGRPDLVLPRYNAVVFVHGCFWHRHPGCQFAYVPKSNTPFWLSKFEANVLRDRRQINELQNLGWTVFVIWECTANKPSVLQRVVDEIRSLLKS